MLVLIDIVDIFAARQRCGGADRRWRWALPRAIWMQLGLRDDAAAAKAEAAGMTVVMDRCIRIDHARLM